MHLMALGPIENRIAKATDELRLLSRKIPRLERKGSRLSQSEVDELEELRLEASDLEKAIGKDNKERNDFKTQIALGMSSRTIMSSGGDDTMDDLTSSVIRHSQFVHHADLFHSRKALQGAIKVKSVKEFVQPTEILSSLQ